MCINQWKLAAITNDISKFDVFAHYNALTCSTNLRLSPAGECARPVAGADRGATTRQYSSEIDSGAVDPRLFPGIFRG